MIVFRSPGRCGVTLIPFPTLIIGESSRPQELGADDWSGRTAFLGFDWASGHPDHDLFGSLPGAGEKLAPRLLAELGDNRERFDSPEALPCHAGTAPVSFQTGQLNKARFRRACQKVLRYTAHLWVDLSRHQCPRANAYYHKKPKEGQSHACALRCVDQRWLKILRKMWQTRERYDAEVHQRNQLKHGSWVIGLLSTQNAQ